MKKKNLDLKLEIETISNLETINGGAAHTNRHCTYNCVTGCTNPQCDDCCPDTQ